MTTEKMHDIEQALAEALHLCRAVGGPWEPCLDGRTCDCRSMARHVWSTDPMHTIARQAAIGAAVERLPADVTIQHTSSGRWRIYLSDHEPEVPTDMWHTGQAAWTLEEAVDRLMDRRHDTVAIAAALEGEG